MVDYYKILEIEPSASESEVKKSYRRLALKYHPDRNQSSGAKEYFILINLAHEILSDPSKRDQYDNKKHYLNGSALDDLVNKQQQNEQYKKYGTYKKYGAKPAPQPERKKDPDFERLEKFGYYGFLSLGIFAFFNSIHDLVYNDFEGINSLTGLIFSLLFTSLLFFSWNKFYKKP